MAMLHSLLWLCNHSIVTLHPFHSYIISITWLPYTHLYMLFIYSTVTVHLSHGYITPSSVVTLNPFRGHMTHPSYGYTTPSSIVRLHPFYGYATQIPCYTTPIPWLHCTHFYNYGAPILWLHYT